MIHWETTWFTLHNTICLKSYFVIWVSSIVISAALYFPNTYFLQTGSTIKRRWIIMVRPHKGLLYLFYEKRYLTHASLDIYSGHRTKLPQNDKSTLWNEHHLMSVLFCSWASYLSRVGSFLFLFPPKREKWKQSLILSRPFQSLIPPPPPLSLAIQLPPQPKVLASKSRPSLTTMPLHQPPSLAGIWPWSLTPSLQYPCSCMDLFEITKKEIACFPSVKQQTMNCTQVVVFYWQGTTLTIRDLSWPQNKWKNLGEHYRDVVGQYETCGTLRIIIICHHMTTTYIHNEWLAVTQQ